MRNSYASNFYNAFVLQCNGKSTNAMCQFQVAYEDAKKAGESLQRLMVIEQLFVWYRTHGSSLRLFAKEPVGYDRIVGAFPSLHLDSRRYQSEWGKTPEQAAIVREFMFGVAETISGVFCATVGSGAGVTGVGIGLSIEGIRRMIISLNSLWAYHEQAYLDLKKWEESANQLVDPNREN
jgi:hypothetical protein